jgi:hypothetical protein
MTKKELLEKIEFCYQFNKVLEFKEEIFLDSIKKELVNSMDNATLSDRQIGWLNIIHGKCMRYYNKQCRR